MEIDYASASIPAHIMDVYDHYRFRYHIQRHAQDAFNGLKTDKSVTG